ncbi:MAG: hypothetical protein GWO07_02630 [Candidatus Dadabacteria bacterium]|nr:hypothetical protein [Candidatus Dadabacteria bacterium]NIS07663.1 hypothetical protein [Candidatus Dadabacteria bacterium]NIV42210.1 hypothetical protein [Candidatus Dadabacteria bacterium]NIY21299.1 hypothetical protein [Candidatus Dadabacteria bacterium]
MSSANEQAENFSNDQKAVRYLDKLLVTKEFDTDEREYIRYILIPMLTRVVENMDDRFNEQLRYMAMELCMKLIPSDEQFKAFVVDWIQKKQRL